MKLMRPSAARLALVGLVLGSALGAAGCSRDPGTQVIVQEADQQAMLKSAEARKKRMDAKAKLPRSKQGAFD